MGQTALSGAGADMTLWCINDASKSSVSGLKGPGAASKSRLGRCHLPAERAPKVLERLLSRIRLVPLLDHEGQSSMLTWLFRVRCNKTITTGPVLHHDLPSCVHQSITHQLGRQQ